MKTLKQWLDEEVGRSKDLAAYLCVSVSTLSQVKNKHRPIPQDWMPHIETFTKGELTVAGMVEMQAKGKLEARKRRTKEKKRAMKSKATHG